MQITDLSTLLIEKRRLPNWDSCRIGEMSPAALIHEIEERFDLMKKARRTLRKAKPSSGPEDVTLALIRIGDLVEPKPYKVLGMHGFETGTSCPSDLAFDAEYLRLWSEANLDRQTIELCPLETAAYLRLTHLEQPKGADIPIASALFEAGDSSFAQVFVIGRRRTGGRYLGTTAAGPRVSWFPDATLIYRLHNLPA